MLPSSSSIPYSTYRKGLLVVVVGGVADVSRKWENHFRNSSNIVPKTGRSKCEFICGSTSYFCFSVSNFTTMRPGLEGETTVSINSCSFFHPSFLEIGKWICSTVLVFANSYFNQFLNGPLYINYPSAFRFDKHLFAIATTRDALRSSGHNLQSVIQ
jgi:hypothetical protein